jgi:very-short-patch-repair endonuclease
MSRHLDPRDIASGSALPVTTVARSALDAARWQSSSRRARGVILSVVQQRLVRPVQLAECLGRLGRVTHAASIASAILDSSGGADSLAEVEVADLVVRAGLPRPRRQVLVETLDGPRRVDIVVDLPDGRLLVIEVDGIHHLSTDVRLADAAKDAAIIAAGHQVLRIPVEALRRDSAALLSQLIAIRESAQRRARMSHKAR